MKVLIPLQIIRYHLDIASRPLHVSGCRTDLLALIISLEVTGVVLHECQEISIEYHIMQPPANIVNITPSYLSSNQKFHGMKMKPSKAVVMQGKNQHQEIDFTSNNMQLQTIDPL